MKEQDWKYIRDKMQPGDKIEILFMRKGRLEIKKTYVVRILDSGISVFEKAGVPNRRFISRESVEEIRSL